MNRDKFKITAGAALLFSAIYFISDWDTILILTLAVGIHELGHLAALRIMGAKVRDVRVSLTGLCISYCGRLSYFNQFIAALMGPLFGIAAAIAAAALGAKFCSSLLNTFAGLSAILSGFNLLPALPLDGGRMLSSLALAANADADRLMDLSGLITGVALLLPGLFFVWQGKGLALFIAAVWLLLGQSGLVKRAGVL